MVGWRAAAQTPGVPAVCCLSECCVPSWDRGCCTDPPGREEGGPWLPACVCHNGVTASAALTRRVRLPERFKGETQLPEHKPWMCFLLFSPSPVDKEGRSLLVKAMFPLSWKQRCKVQPRKAAAPLSGGRPIFYIYQLSKETAGLAVCWQRQSTSFLCCTSLQMFTGTKHKRHSSVICLQSLKMSYKVYSDCRQENGGSVVILSVYKLHRSRFTDVLLA